MLEFFFVACVFITLFCFIAAIPLWLLGKSLENIGKMLDYFENKKK